MGLGGGLRLRGVPEVRRVPEGALVGAVSSKPGVWVLRGSED